MDILWLAEKEVEGLITVEAALPLVRRIVTDLRRPNEAKALLDLGATLVLVVRDGVVWDGHETEAMAGMATGRWRGGCSHPPYHLVVENAFPVDGDTSMIPAATAAFEKAANQLLDAVLSTAR
jgi:hypothetical protein